MKTTFRYRAADTAGRVLEGDVQSASKREAIEDLRRRELYPFDVHELNAVTAVSRTGTASIGDALATWTRMVATMLSAGMTLDRALGFPAMEAGNASLANAVSDVSRDVREGSSFAAALRKRPKVFNQLYVAMVSAGEETGALDAVMSRLADNLDESAELKSRLRSAFLYPALMAVVAAIGVTVILLFVIPRFVDILGEVGGTLPLSTRILIGAGGVVRVWWLWVPPVLFAIWAVMRWLSDQANLATWHGARLGIPITGSLERTQATATFTRTMGLLLQSGISVLPALRISRSTIHNLAIAARVERATENVAAGKRLGAELQGTLPPLAVQLIALGEETGRLGELCLRAADNSERELSRRLRTLIALLEPALIVAFGVMVGFVALAMLQAIYSINANVS